MGVLLDFNFLAILNLFVLLLWPVYNYRPTTSEPNRWGPLALIMVIVTAIVIFGDIVFLVLKMTGHS